jgi:hypothetical protein
MRRVRVESLEMRETKGTRMPLPADPGSLAIFCPHQVWGKLLADALTFGKPFQMTSWGWNTQGSTSTSIP